MSASRSRDLLRRRAKCKSQPDIASEVGSKAQGLGPQLGELDRTKQPIPREIWILVSAASIIALGFGLIAPILLQHTRSFGVGALAASFMVSSFSIFRLIFAPASDSLVEKLGYRHTYLTGISIVAFSTLLVGVAQTYWQLLASRALGGIGSAMFTVSAMGLIARISPSEIRGKSSATYGTAFLLGNVFGPIIGVAMGAWGMRVSSFVYGGVLIAATIVVGMSLGAEHLRHVVSKRATPVPKLSEAIRDSAYRSALVGTFANGWLNFGARVAIVPLFAAATFSHVGAPEPDSNGAVAATATADLALTAFALGNVTILQFSGRLSDRIGHRPLLITGLLINGVFAGAIRFNSGAIPLLIPSVLTGFGTGMVNPSQQAVFADVIGANRQGGKVLANFQMAQDFGAISGPLIIGAIVDATGFKAGFLVCGVISLVAMVGWIFGRETLPVQSSNSGVKETRAKTA